MKKDEAISILATSARPREPKNRTRYDEAVKMAIEALRQPEPRSSSRSHENDLIGRQAAIDEVSKYASIWMEYDGGMTQEEVAEAALKAAKRTMVHILEELPSAQPERKTGRWIDNETSYVDDARQTCTCSVCGRRSHRPLGCFCRWCGARMEADT